VPTAPVAGGTAIPPEFQVNDFTAGSQRVPDVAPAANGGLVVTWQSAAQDGDGTGVRARLFDGTGMPTGGEIAVNSTTVGDQDGPAIAAASTGAFVVVWRSEGQDGSGSGIFGQRFDPAGNPAGSEFPVNTFTTGEQITPDVAADAAGNFVVVWNSDGQDGSGTGIFAQRFSSTGVPLGAEFQVNTFTQNVQRRPAIAAAANGDFVVAWESGNQDGSDDGLFAQRYNAAGTAQGGEFPLNTTTALNQRRVALAAAAAGDFVATWQSELQDGSEEAIVARRFAANGSPLGGEFLVNSFTTGAQRAPDVAISPDGSFFIAWLSFMQDGSGEGVFARRFSPQGVAATDELPVNVFTAGAQEEVTVTAVGSGSSVAIWSSDAQDGSSDGVYGRIFGFIFADGFESGDTTAWDQAVP
jgi:hypothetical protein